MSNEPDEGKEVLEWVMASGHFDEIRKKVTEQLRQSAELKEYTMIQLEDSKTLSQYADYNPGAKKKVLEDLKRELEEKLLDEASKTAWSIMDSSTPIGKLIEQKVCEALTAIYEKRSQEQSQAPPISAPSYPYGPQSGGAYQPGSNGGPKLQGYDYGRL